MVAILDQLVERLLNTEEDVGSSFETKKKYIPLFLLFLLIFADFKAFLSHKQPPTKTKKGHYRHIRWSWSRCARIGPASVVQYASLLHFLMPFLLQIFI